MSGITVPLALPYPTDGDLVAQTDESIQALAEAVDDNLAEFAVKNPSAYRLMGTSNDFASAAYAVFPQAADAAALQLSITKRLGAADSALLVHVAGCAAVSAGPLVAGKLGVRIGGVDYDCCHIGTPTTVRSHFSGLRPITGLAAGAKVIAPVFKCGAAGSTWRFWQNDDFLSISVREVIL